jgi:hypothetical protein
MDYLNKEIKKVRDQIADLIDQNPSLRQKKELLVSIPATGKATIAVILVELDNLEKFNYVRELVAFIGLAPKETLSGSSIKGKPRLCKVGHARLRKALYMPAIIDLQDGAVLKIFFDAFHKENFFGKGFFSYLMSPVLDLFFVSSLRVDLSDPPCITITRHPDRDIWMQFPEAISFRA